MAVKKPAKKAPKKAASKARIKGAYTRDHDEVRVTVHEVESEIHLDFLTAHPGELIVTTNAGVQSIWQRRAFAKHFTKVGK